METVVSQKVISAALQIQQNSRIVRLESGRQPLAARVQDARPARVPSSVWCQVRHRLLNRLRHQHHQFQFQYQDLGQHQFQHHLGQRDQVVMENQKTT